MNEELNLAEGTQCIPSALMNGKILIISSEYSNDTHFAMEI